MEPFDVGPRNRSWFGTSDLVLKVRFQVKVGGWMVQAQLTDGKLARGQWRRKGSAMLAGYICFPHT